MWCPTKRGKELYEERDIQYLMNNVAWGDSFAMEAIGLDYLRRVDRKVDDNVDSSDDDIDIMDGIFLAIYWFDRAIESGKINTNYWIGETIDFEARTRGSSSAYYRHFFLEHLSRFKESSVFEKVMASKTGYLYKILQDEGICHFDSKIYYSKAVNVGDSSAAYRLGELYLWDWYRDYKNHLAYPSDYVKPCTNDLLEAKKYLDYAAKNGEDEAFNLIFEVIQGMSEAAR
ncbi:sel1 repeat family protein [Selenomonas sp. KH1T6]|uniref:sel1 repeat family protein n=1 Tax=Selenomonas sp. KH1T6 TaxID=3158784 RepID=UPI0008A7983F|nr:hypothetical protein SAMN05216583_1602 [Selenomonas ruminantium]